MQFPYPFLFFFIISQLKFPSSLASFEQIINCANGKRIALFLDYDGTLSPIVDNPDCAFMSDSVCNIHQKERVANISLLLRFSVQNLT